MNLGSRDHRRCICVGVCLYTWFVYVCACVRVCVIGAWQNDSLYQDDISSVGSRSIPNVSSWASDLASYVDSVVQFVCVCVCVCACVDVFHTFLSGFQPVREPCSFYWYTRTSFCIPQRFRRFGGEPSSEGDANESMTSAVMDAANEEEMDEPDIVVRVVFYFFSPLPCICWLDCVVA